MTTALSDFGRALRAERLKLRGTLAFWLALIAPAVVVVVEVMMVFWRVDALRATQPSDIWVDHAMQILVLWTLLMMPLFVTLETALAAQLDHSPRAWKHLFALPVSRGAIYAAKQVGSMMLIGLSLIALVLWTLLSGIVIRITIPGIGFEAPAPLWDIVSFAFFTFLGAWLVTAIQTWVAHRWSSFTVASAVGIAMTIVGVMVIQSEYAGLYPWTLPVLVANGFNNSIQPINILEEGVRPVRELLMGTLGGIVVAIVAGWNFVRRDVF